jgi:uncharacterized membrane protein YiaA
MHLFTRPVSIALAFTLAVSGLVGLWFGTVPQTLSPRSYMVTVALMMALAAISVIAFRNAQGTGSVAQLLYETDSAPLPPTSGSQRTLPVRKAV